MEAGAGGVGHEQLRTLLADQRGQARGRPAAVGEGAGGAAVNRGSGALCRETAAWLAMGRPQRNVRI